MVRIITAKRLKSLYGLIDQYRFEAEVEARHCEAAQAYAENLESRLQNLARANAAHIEQKRQGQNTLKKAQKDLEYYKEKACYFGRITQGVKDVISMNELADKAKGE